MLEVRYILATKKVTGWCGDPKQFGNLKDRGGEKIVIVNIPIPPKPCRAYLFDEAINTLIDNPDYIEPAPSRDFGDEIDKIKVRVKKLEEKEKP